MLAFLQSLLAFLPLFAGSYSVIAGLTHNLLILPMNLFEICPYQLQSSTTLLIGWCPHQTKRKQTNMQSDSSLSAGVFTKRNENKQICNRILPYRRVSSPTETKQTNMQSDSSLSVGVSTNRNETNKYAIGFFLIGRCLHQPKRKQTNMQSDSSLSVGVITNRNENK